MTAQPDPLGNEWARVLACRKARRMSRQLAGVGVGIPAARLREIAAGAQAGTDEWVDVIFGLTASQIRREERTARFARVRRRSLHWLVVAGMVLAGLNVLACMAFVLFTLALQGSPY